MRRYVRVERVNGMYEVQVVRIDGEIKSKYVYCHYKSDVIANKNASYLADELQCSMIGSV